MIETINLHIWPKCNLACVYCYGTFPERPKALRYSEWARVVDVIAAEGVKRVTFSGGEPTLHPDFGAILKHARLVGLQTAIITNGARLSDAHLDQLDLVGITLDAVRPELLASLGRGAGYLETVRDIAQKTRSAGAKLKINTVVCSTNVEEDLAAMLLELAPWKWKPLQFTFVPGENDATAASLAVGVERFEEFVARHRIGLRHGSIWIAPESERTIQSTYVMIDPEGRVFQHSSAGHRVSRPVLDVGLAAALAEAGGYDRQAFLARGGDVEVRRLPVLQGVRQ